MKIAALSGAILLISSAALAGSYSFDCSNAAGTIRIKAGGRVASVHGKEYSSLIRLADLELWDSAGDSAQVEVISAGERKVLHLFTENSCREITQLSFVQELTIRDRKDRKTLATDFMICDNSSATTTGGRDCTEEP
ncbi:MAG: hypothetical protein NDJ90_00630 [Oligoflexia bacterium]|nr:hypothetical protein [Oligoflexia bacterium]